MSENSSEIFLKVRKLNFQYGVIPIVKDVSFSIERGQILGVSGPSGSGKTSILRLIAGLEKPLSGEILMQGTCVSDGKSILPPNIRGCAMVFQGFALWPHMTVKKHLQFVCPKGEENTGRIHEILKMLALKEKIDSYPGELSGGEQQRLAFARAVVNPPDYLLMDEPFSNLDSSRRQTMLSYLKRLSSEKQTTIVYVSHNYQELMLLADRVLLLEEGRQSFFGTNHEFSGKYPSF